MVKTRGAFKPFVVQGGVGGSNIFHIASLSDDVTRDRVEMFFERLPLRFSVRKEAYPGSESFNEPLSVDIDGGLIYIYPPKDRILACASFVSWHVPTVAEVTSKMHVDNMNDVVSPGNGQIRSCIHFDASVLGLERWTDDNENQIEVDVFVYPREKKNETKLIAPRFGKVEVGRLLDLLADGEGGELTIEGVERWRDLILYAVRTMRAGYEPPKEYYEGTFVAIEKAASPIEFRKTLQDLRSSIKWG